LEESGTVYFRILFQHLHGGTEEIHKMLSGFIFVVVFFLDETLQISDSSARNQWNAF
jgi:hypothetical protein